MTNQTPNQPKGILKNAIHDSASLDQSSGTTSTATPPSATSSSTIHSIEDKFDRKQVIENTKLNSQLLSESSSKGDKIRSKIQQLKEEQESRRLHLKTQSDHLKWDEKNILINEMEKSSTMKIDEPKTPYEGGFDPNNDYYRSDNEDDEDDDNNDNKAIATDKNDSSKLDDVDELEQIDLGDGLNDNEEGDIIDQSRRILKSTYEDGEEPVAEEEEEEDGDEEEEEEELSAEEKHRRFEEMRKQHYHLKGNALKIPIQVSDDEDAE